MIGWGWVVAAFYAGAALGFYLAALLAISGRDEQP